MTASTFGTLIWGLLSFYLIYAYVMQVKTSSYLFKIVDRQKEEIKLLCKDNDELSKMFKESQAINKEFAHVILFSGFGNKNKITEKNKTDKDNKVTN